MASRKHLNPVVINRPPLFRLNRLGRIVSEPVFVMGAFLIVYLMLGCISIVHCRLLADEGWYTYASKAVYNGVVPYRDFLFTQMPLAPYVYGIMMKLFEPSISAGRIASLMFGVVSIGLILHLFKKNTAMMLIVGAFLILNLNFVFDTTIVRTQSLTVLLTAAALACFTHIREKPHWVMIWMSLAVMTRLSILPALLITWNYCLILNRDAFAKTFLMVITNAMSLFGIAVFLNLLSKGNFVFGVFSFHSEYYPNAHWSIDVLFRFAVDVFKNQGLLTIAVLVSSIGAASGCIVPKWNILNKHELQLTSFSFICWLATTLIHATRSVPFAAYQTSNMMFAVASATPWLIAFFRNRSKIHCRLFSLLFATAVAVSILFQEFPVVSDEGGAWGQYQEAVREVTELTDNGAKTILTFSPELAAETSAVLISGYEMGMFSYFPNFSDADAARLRIVNKEKLLKDVETAAADIVCLTGHNIVIMLADGDPSQYKGLFSRIQNNYVLHAKVTKYGQFRDTLFVFAKRWVSASLRSKEK
jgi:hypothetical protein